MNESAFEWGRRAAYDLAAVESAAGIIAEPQQSASLEDIVARRVAFLTDYQNPRYAEQFRARIARLQALGGRMAPGEGKALAEAAAHSLFKLMAIKDEYEVARLYTDGSFERQLSEEFDSWDSLEFHLAPPLIARRDKRTNHLRKGSFGPWMMRAFRVLAKLRSVRGTALDPFSYLAERRWERRLLAEYEAVLDAIEAGLAPHNYAIGVALAAYPQKIRGFGHVKEAQARPALAERDRLLKAFREAEPTPYAEAAE
jgi:indolepyruvate ferredoxin oxidoreductase